MATTTKREPANHRAMLADQFMLSKSDVATVLCIDEKDVMSLHSNGKLRGTQVGKILCWKPAWIKEFVAGLTQEN